jgi:hypothetical protein
MGRQQTYKYKADEICVVRQTHGPESIARLGMTLVAMWGGTRGVTAI